jgi:Protein of unknown function (DUF2796)
MSITRLPVTTAGPLSRPWPVLPYTCAMHLYAPCRPCFGARLIACTGFLALIMVPAYAARPHVHGNATLEIAIEGQRVTVEFSTPLDNLVGFERAPRTAQEKLLANQTMERLRKPEDLFVPTAAARCTRIAAGVDAPVWDAPYKAPKGEHAALTATIEFRCEQPQSLRSLRVMAFDAFPRLKNIDAQVAGGTKQRAARITSGNRTLFW